MKKFPYKWFESCSGVYILSNTFCLVKNRWEKEKKSRELLKALQSCWPPIRMNMIKGVKENCDWWKFVCSILWPCFKKTRVISDLCISPGKSIFEHPQSHLHQRFDKFSRYKLKTRAIISIWQSPLPTFYLISVLNYTRPFLSRFLRSSSNSSTRGPLPCWKKNYPDTTFSN